MRLAADVPRTVRLWCEYYLVRQTLVFPIRGPRVPVARTDCVTLRWSLTLALASSSLLRAPKGMPLVAAARSSLRPRRTKIARICNIQLSQAQDRYPRAASFTDRLAARSADN